MAYESKEQDWKATYIYIVDIEIIKGIELAKADTFGSSDGFVKVQCLNRKFRTITLQNDLNPIWNAKTQFQFYREPKEVLFRVLDYNKAQKDKPIGNYTLSLDGFFKVGSEGFKGCVKLQDVKRGEIEIAVGCKRLAPFDLLGDVSKCVRRLDDYKSEMVKCRQQLSNCKQQCKTLESECPAIKGVCERLTKECQEKEKEERRCDREGRRYDEEIEKLETECSRYKGQYDDLKTSYKSQKERLKGIKEEYTKKEERLTDVDRYALRDKMDKYVLTIYGEEEEEIEYDEELYIGVYKEIIIEYKARDLKARRYESQYGPSGDDETYGDDDYDGDEKNEYRINREAADSYLVEIQKWHNGCLEANQLKKDKCLQEYDITEGIEINFFSNFYISLCKYFFDLHIIGATLQEYNDEIKKTINKRVSKCTFNDLAGMDNSTGIWQKLYTDLDFVVDELGDIFNALIKKKPIQSLCQRSIDFIRDCYYGYYPKFCKLMAFYICQAILEQEIVDNPNHLLEDAMGGLILLLNDKKCFAVKLYQSMDDNYNADECDEPPEDAYEQIIALIIVCICKLDCLGADDILDEKDKKQINDQLQCVLAKCGELQIDKESIQIIKQFFNYFFAPESNACCQCDGDQGGIGGFFGSIFGSICQK